MSFKNKKRITQSYPGFMMKFPSKTPDLSISWLQMLPGLIVGGMYAFSMYGLMYLMRETFRLLSISWDYHLWELSEEGVYFYNFIFAYIGVLFGQMICFNLWFNRPRSLLGVLNYRRVQILADSRTSIWYFMSWFSKLAVVYGVVFGIWYGGAFDCFTIYPDYQYLIYMTLSVLFLNQWTWLLIVLRKKVWKWMLVSFVVTILLAFCLSRINLVDYKKINNRYLKYNLEKRYELDYPESETYTKPYRWSLGESIYVGYPKNHSPKDKPVIIADYEELPIENIESILQNWRVERDEFDHRFMYITMHIDNDVPLRLVKKLETKIANTGILRIFYRVKSNDYAACENSGPLMFPKTLLKDIKGSPPGLNMFIKSAFSKERLIKVEANQDGQILIDGTVIGKENVVSVIKQLLIDSHEYSILYYPSMDLTFGEYFKTYENIRFSIEQLRNIFSQKLFGKEYQELILESQLEEVKERFPILIIEPDDLKPVDLKSQ